MSPHHLENKFLLTGASTLAPKPSVPYTTLENAKHQAETMLRSKDCTAEAMIIWVPYLIVEREIPPPPPIRVRSPIVHAPAPESSETEEQS